MCKVTVLAYFSLITVAHPTGIVRYCEGSHCDYIQGHWPAGQGENREINMPNLKHKIWRFRCGKYSNRGLGYDTVCPGRQVPTFSWTAAYCKSAVLIFTAVKNSKIKFKSICSLGSFLKGEIRNESINLEIWRKGQLLCEQNKSDIKVELRGTGQ